MNDGMDETPPTTPEGPIGPSLSAEGDTVVVAQRRGPGLHVATIIGILALLAGGVFAFKNISGSKSGGSSPEEAIRSLLDAASNEDVIGVLQQLDPGERDAFREPLESIRNELVRLGALEKNADLSGFPGIDIQFSDVTLAPSPLSDDVSLVRITGGKASFSVDPAKLPFGSFLRNATEGALRSARTTTKEIGGGEDDFIVAVRRNGRWYASLYYSIAEGVRRDAGAPVPNFGAGVEPIGADSPEKAIDGLLRAAASLNIRSLIAGTPPDEMAALHDYALLFLSQSDELRSAVGNVRVSITKLELGSKTLEDGAALVTVEQFGVRVAMDDGTFTATYDGNCLVTSGVPFLPPRTCGDELRKNVPSYFQVARGDLGFVVVERDGKWYLSPTRTLLHSVVTSLQAMKPGDLEKIAGFLQGMAFSESSQSSESAVLTPASPG